jgi:hypothetical protein
MAPPWRRDPGLPGRRRRPAWRPHGSAASPAARVAGIRPVPPAGGDHRQIPAQVSRLLETTSGGRLARAGIRPTPGIRVRVPVSKVAAPHGSASQNDRARVNQPSRMAARPHHLHKRFDGCGIGYWSEVPGGAHSGADQAADRTPTLRGGGEGPGRRRGGATSLVAAGGDGHSRRRYGGHGIGDEGEDPPPITSTMTSIQAWVPPLGKKFFEATITRTRIWH